MPRPATARLRPRDLLRERLIDEVAISPDGELVVYTERTVVKGKDRTSLWAVPFRGGTARRLTHGEWTDSRPRFSPDGATLAFTSNREKQTAQVWLLPVAGGEARQLTEFRRGIAEHEWMPDGRRLAVIAYDDDSPVLRGAREKEAATARVLHRVDWRLDGVGPLDHPAHVHLVPLRGRPRRLTKGTWSASILRPHPDGSRIGFLADRRDDGDLNPFHQIHEVDLAHGRVRQRSKLAGRASSFSYEPDGAAICVAEPRHPSSTHDPWGVYRVDRGGRAHPLTADADRWFGQGFTNDERVSVMHSNGRDLPYRIADEGGGPLVDPELWPAASALAVAGGRVAAVMTLGHTPNPDIYALEAGREPRRLTRTGASWLSARREPAWEAREIRGPGGPIQTFLLAPPGRKRPRATILLIHGGPTWAWSAAATSDSVLWAEAGYLVATPNIRGSYDRGAAWVEPLHANWGGVDAEDCHAVLDHLVQSGEADPKKLGVHGNSYGGFLTSWLVGTSDRFAAAVSSNGVSNQIAAFGSSDCGLEFNEAEGLGMATSPEGVELLWRQSPLRHAHNITTPLLMIQGESDLRCPASDNEQLFTTLRALKRNVEYVLYLESDHSMRHTARPDRRVDRHERVLGWFQRYMPA